MQLDCKKLLSSCTRAAGVLALALGVFMARQEALHHDFAHAVEPLGGLACEAAGQAREKSRPVHCAAHDAPEPAHDHDTPGECPLHGLYADLSAGVAVAWAAPSIAAPCVQSPAHAYRVHFPAARYAFRSRAPPSLQA